MCAKAAGRLEQGYRNQGKLVPEFVYNRKVRYDEKEKSKFELKFLKLKDELAYAGNIFKKPADMCYGIKKENKASYLSAIIVLVAFVVVYLLDMYASGFLFRVESGMGNAFTQILVVLAIFMLWCATNYLVSTLNDGEGWFKDFFIGTCYCLIPFIVIKAVSDGKGGADEYRKLVMSASKSYIELIYKVLEVI